MLASSSKLFIAFVCLFIATSALVQSHELSFNRRDHGPKRFLRNPATLSSANSDSQTTTSTVSQSTASDTSPQTTPSLASIPATIATSIPITITIPFTSIGPSSQSTSSTNSSSVSSSTTTSASSSSTPTSQTSPTINLNPDPVPVGPSTNVVASTITSTQSLSATPSETAVSQVQSASTKTKSTTVTALIAVAASVGGIAILWTIFRKWKLSSSKEFDRRLNPITDWQPTNGDDDGPALRRSPSSSSSFHSGGGSANGHAGIAPLDHDFTAGAGNSAPVGGYADLARASSPNAPMQQALGRGPSFNHGYNVGVPLHHQTSYGTYDAYAGGARY